VAGAEGGGHFVQVGLGPPIYRLFSKCEEFGLTLALRRVPVDRPEGHALFTTDSGELHHSNALREYVPSSLSALRHPTPSGNPARST
jgi:hypothetical protein